MLPLMGVAQDIHFSQYLYNPLNISAAQTGLFDGDIRVNAFFRQQWSSVTVPYKTFGVAYDQVIGTASPKGNRNSGGMMINSDRAGDGNLGTLQMMLSYAHLFALGSDSIHFLSLGAQAGIIYRSLDVNELTFDNQFTGDVFNPSANSGETFDRTNYIYPDINAGCTWMGLFDNFNLSSGISIQHFMEPDQSFLGERYDLEHHTQFFISGLLRRDNSISYIPSVYWSDQDEFNELLFGMEVKFAMQQNTVRKRAVSLGGHYRIDDAVIPSFALYYDQWRFGISYDINTSSLKKASNGRGGPELNLTYIMKKIRYKAGKNVCPVY
jgi:type IX secretion system PorP/SprF family membrane protein